ENIDIVLGEISVGGQLIFTKVMISTTVSGYRALDSGSFDVITTAVCKNITITVRLDSSNLTPMQIANADLYHYDNKTQEWEKVTTERGDDYIKGFSPSASPFAVMVPINDYMAPETVIVAKAIYETELGIYLPANKEIILEAEDMSDGTSDVSGVATTYYLINNEPTQQCLSTPFDVNAAAGTCANPIYTAPFTLSEGIHSLYYFSVDYLNNHEIGKSTVVYADGTSPITTIAVGDSEFGAGETAYITETDLITLTAIDPVSNDVASGIDQTLVLINRYPDEACENTPDDPNAPQGTCENPEYAAPFTLSAGTHTIYYMSCDNVENEEEIKTAYINVSVPETQIVLDINPDTLNLKSQGKYITMYFEVKSGTKTAADIEASMLKIVEINGQNLANPISVIQETAGSSGKIKFGTVGDYDSNGISDLMVKFDRQDAIQFLPIGEQVEIKVEGKFKDGTTFMAEDYIRVILPGNIRANSGGAVFHNLGAKADIPANALHLDTDINIVRLTKTPESDNEKRKKSYQKKGLSEAGTLFEFGPEGTKFIKPVTITLPYSLADIGIGLNENNSTMAYWDK
ncbi:MAG: hypothetical protein KAI33_08255, partial [Elusimicrobiales bacterium]|nr:hypothetical protein [Elusimicrobiales bacterium]